jgi:hypothetical protein
MKSKRSKDRAQAALTAGDEVIASCRRQPTTCAHAVQGVVRGTAARKASSSWTVDQAGGAGAQGFGKGQVVATPAGVI